MRPILYPLLAFGLLLAFSVLGRAELPVGLVAGDGYGRSEVKSLIESVFNSELPNVVYEDCGEFLTPEEFSKYRMVVLAGGNSIRSYTSEETAQIEDYVRKGGRLLLINQSPKMFSLADGQVDRDSSYLFGRSYFRRDNPECTIYQPDSPLLAGALKENPAPFWLQANVLLKNPDWENIIGSDDFILVGQRAIENGKVYYAGTELFRILKRSREQNVADAEGWVAILKNILSEK